MERKDPHHHESPSTSLLEWFGTSVLRDAEGHPLRCFHGTSSSEPFDVFDAGRQGQTAGVGGGFFFTDKPETALDVYGWRSGGVVLECFLVAERPLTFEGYFKAAGLDRLAELEDGRLNPTNYFDENSEAILAFARANGHDSIVWKDESGDEYACDLYVVFEPWQAKSATHCAHYSRNTSSMTGGLPADALWDASPTRRMAP